MKKFKITLLLFLFIVQLYGQQTLSQKHFNLKSNLALEGYDAVSYFNKNPLKGSSSYSYTHQGVIYYFNNLNNKNTFIKNPDGYKPQFGGWCAYAMGNTGEKVSVDPKTYKIVSGKLYLFYNSFFNNTLNDWNKDENNLKIKAETNWKKIYK